MYRLSGLKISSRKRSNPLLGFGIRLDKGSLFATNGVEETKIQSHTKLAGSEEVISDFDSVNITTGKSSGKYSTEGTTATCVFEDSRVKHTLNIEVKAYDIILDFEVDYKQDCTIEKEGIKFDGDGVFNRQFAHIEGDYLHAGNIGIYTYLGEEVAKRTADNGEVTWIGEKDKLSTDLESVKFIGFKEKSDYTSIRLLHQPNGINASWHYTNHGDRMHKDWIRAVMWGTNDTESPDYGEKGFNAHGIKLTFSVFARDDYTDVHWGLKDDPEYKQIVDSLDALGHEIIPHSTRGNSAGEDRATTESLLPEYDDYLPMKGWIDHGLGSGIDSSGIGSKGWNPDETNWYIMDLLEDAGIYNAWSYRDFFGQVDMLSDDLFGWPHFILYQHPLAVLPTSGEMMWLWPSARREYKFFGMQNAYIQQVIDACGCVDKHEYMMEELSENDTWEESGGKYIITDQFEEHLTLLEQKINAGELWNSTKTEWVDFNIKLKALSITMVDEKTFTINNPNATVEGCSFLLGELGLNPKLNGVAMNTKAVKRGTICWADLPTGNNTLTI